MFFVGIDPGTATGAIAAIGEGGAGDVRNFPRTEAELIDLLRDAKDRGDELRVVLERILMTPYLAKLKGTQKLVGSYHFLRGALQALEIPFEALTPRQWQAALGLGSLHKDERKAELYQKARELFPSSKVTKRNADAFLLAEVARRRFGGSS
jgi:hypothetical protein